MKLTIVFLGLCCFIENGIAPRTAVLLDLAAGSRVHGHRIQAHEAFLRIPQDSVVETNWPHRPRGKDFLFPLDHQRLSFAGLPPAPPLHIAPPYRCFVPRLTAECPEFGALKPLAAIIDTAIAALDLQEGDLSAYIEKTDGPVSSVFTHPTNGNVTIRGERPDHSVLTIVVKPDTTMAMVNQPRDKEGTPNHFLAYYQLSANDNCCTNVPFRDLPPGCEAVKNPGAPEGAPKRDPDVMSTVACSNSNYP